MEGKHINFNEKLFVICQEAEQETIKLLEENGLEKLALSEDVDFSYATHDGFNGMTDDLVLDVRIFVDTKGKKYMQFLCEDSNEWEFYSEVQSTIALDLYESVYQTLSYNNE